MEDPNKDIESFFTAMRKEDKEVVVPSLETILPQKKHVSRKTYFAIGIAAVVLLCATIVLRNTNTEALPAEQEVIIGLEIPGKPYETSLFEEPSIYEWESSSAFLVNDFND